METDVCSLFHILNSASLSESIWEPNPDIVQTTGKQRCKHSCLILPFQTVSVSPSKKKKRLVEKDEGGKWVIWVTCFRRLMSRLFPSEDNLPVHLCFARSFLKTRRGGTLPVLSRRLCAQLKRQMEGRSYRRRAKDARIFTSTANGEHLGGLNRASCVSAGVQYYHSELYP